MVSEHVVIYQHIKNANLHERIMGRIKSTWLLIFATTACLLPASSWAQVVTTSNEVEARVRVDGSVVLVDDAPYFARVIQHNGEPFTYLKSLGFNTIQLTAPANESQLKEAAAVGVWLVCPPPASIAVHAVPARYDSVLAWSLGEQATSRNEQLIREQAREVREADKRRKRPTFAHAASNWHAIHRETDIAGLGFEPIGTSFELRKYGNWIRQRNPNWRQPIWADIQTELPTALTRQVSVFLDNQPPLPIEYEQLKFMLYEAISAGARGIRFLSKNRLDGSDAAAQFRAQSLRSLLQHAEQISTWAAGGLAEKQNSSLQDVEVHSVRFAGSTLLLIQRTTGFEQWACGDLAPAVTSIGDFVSSTGDRFYTINELGAQLSDNQPGTTRRSLSVNCPFAASVLLTQDPLLVQAVNQASSPNMARERINLTQQSLALLNRFELELPPLGQGFPVVATARQQAEGAIRYAEQVWRQGNQALGLKQIDLADAHIASARRQVLQQQRQASGFISSPLLTHIGLIPNHIALVQRLTGLTWNPNSLPGGDFESLDQMTQSGWKNRRDESHGLATKVELAADATVDGSYGMKLTVTAGNQLNNAAGTNPLWIRSAEVAVKKNQLIRFHGFVNVSRPFTNSLDGMLIIDSICGPKMATQVTQTPGWQEFTIYRMSPRDQDVSLKFEMAGAGQVMLDEVTIRTMNVTENTLQAFSENGIETK